MECTLDSIKNNKWVAGSLVAVGLTAGGAAAHQFGLFALCSKRVLDAYGHVAAVVSRHRFASVVLALAAVGMICLVAVAAVLRSRKSEHTRQSIKITPEERIPKFLNGYENVKQFLSVYSIPVTLRNDSSKWNEMSEENLVTLIETVLVNYLEGKIIPFCAFFKPSYLTIQSSELNEAQSTQVQRQGSQSIFPADVRTERMQEYADLLEAIIKHHDDGPGMSRILPGDSFRYYFEITIGDEEEAHCIGDRRLNEL
jgi:hypothetical protein